MRAVDLAEKLAYYRALSRSAPIGSLLRSSARKLVRAAARASRPGLRLPRPVEVERAARALCAAPSPFDDADGARRQVFERELAGDVAAVVAAARRAAAGEVEVFGRPANAFELYRDPLSGREAGELADPKGPWEVARYGHLVQLGVAARLDPTVAADLRRGFATQLRAFVNACPPGVGLHWTSPLEAAIRSIHWLAAFHLLGGAGALGRDTTRELAQVLLAHGRMIATNLEDTGVVRANHLVGDLVGLLWLGVALGERDWRKQALRGLLRELDRQVHPDGAGFEGSTAYHRFVLELFVAAAVMCRAAQLPLPAPFWSRLRRMFGFVRGYLLPDGTDPGFGDADDARVLPFADRDPRDHAYLLSIGAMLLGDPELKPEGSTFSPEALWLGGAAGYRRWRQLDFTPAPGSQSFPDGGLYVMRHGADYLAVRCGEVGQDGVGGHSHNDQLSLVACAGGKPVVVDSGTGAYTLDALMRDQFRGSAAHAGVIVDGCEQAELPDRAFALFEQTHARPLSWESGPVRDRFVGEHRGYLARRPRVRHRREVTFHKDSRAFVVTDLLAGAGWHDVEVCFPLPSLEARTEPGAISARRLADLAHRAIWARAGFDLRLAVEVGPAAAPVALVLPFANQGLKLDLRESVRSPRYGQVVPIRSARYFVRASLPCVVTIALVALADLEDRR